MLTYISILLIAFIVYLVARKPYHVVMSQDGLTNETVTREFNSRRKALEFADKQRAYFDYIWLKHKSDSITIKALRWN